jgi:prepilin-type N-terminal cleavage/methylation domain-containing protein
VKAGRQCEGGYSLVEILAVVGIMGIMAGMAATILTNVIPMAHANSSFDLLAGKLRQARPMAVDQCQNYIAAFQATNEFVLAPQELSGPTAPVADYLFSNNVTHTTVASVPETPDGLGNSMAVSFAGATRLFL